MGGDSDGKGGTGGQASMCTPDDRAGSGDERLEFVVELIEEDLD